MVPLEPVQTPIDLAPALIRSPWWGVVGLAFLCGLAWNAVRADAQTAKTDATTALQLASSQAETINGLARYACRQNRADAVLAGLSCDALLRDRP
jgi:hypothetical protein